MDSGEVLLWKDGKKIDSWVDIFKNTSLTCIFSVQFSPDGNRLAWTSREIYKVFIFDVDSMTFLAQVPIYGPKDDVLAICTFFNNEYLVCSSTDHTLYFIKAENGVIVTCLDFGDIPAPLSVCRQRKHYLCCT